LELVYTEIFKHQHLLPPTFSHPYKISTLQQNFIAPWKNAFAVSGNVSHFLNFKIFEGTAVIKVNYFIKVQLITEPPVRQAMISSNRAFSTSESDYKLIDLAIVSFNT